MFAEARDEERIVQRVAALDIGKAELVCCIRLPGEDGRTRRRQEVSTHSTMVGSLTALATRLVELGIERVVMEATSEYWKPPFYLFEAHGLNPWLVNARDVKHLPGRPKTDVQDSVWLCKVAERGMLRPSFVPPVQIRQLRGLTRYRANLVDQRTAEKNRVEKLLEDACIKLSVVASDIHGVSGRAMLEAMIAGQRDPTVLADLARTRLRTKIPQLEQAFAGLRLGTFTDHHARLLRHMLAHIDHLNATITALEDDITTALAPFTTQVTAIAQIPGVSGTAAAAIIAEIGVDMTRFPTPAHLASWAKVCPLAKSSAGKTRGKTTTGKGNRYLARALGETATAAGRTKTRLGARYHRLAHRRGKKPAVVAVARSQLIAAWHLLANPTIGYLELGPDYYNHPLDNEMKKRRYVRELEAIGYHVTLRETAA